MEFSRATTTALVPIVNRSLIAMEGCIESLYEDWAGQEELPIDALSLETFLMPSVSELSQDDNDLLRFQSHGGAWRLGTLCRASICTLCALLTKPLPLAGVSPVLQVCSMKTEAFPCTPSLLLVPQQQSISAGSTESERDESGDENCAGAVTFTTAPFVTFTTPAA